MKHTLALALIAVGLIIFVSGSIASLSGLGASCVSIYGANPATIQAQGTPVSASAFFAAQSANQAYEGFSNWVTVTNNGITTWTATNAAGQQAAITWDANVVQWTNPGAFVGNPPMPVGPQFYDLTAYVTGTCINSQPTSTTQASSTTASQTTITSSRQTTTMSSSSATSQTSTTASQSTSISTSTITTSIQPIGSVAPPSPYVPYLPWAGIGLMGVGGFLYVKGGKR